ncbi:hypothetical protein [Parvibaculum sp.]|uniref:hypothetical protein n=1 Tax=Parvibaculum sp. TaxID=2024848 RepID=UPI002C6D4C9F|nr:hypothetical protein [Parvibaculum sp.]HUD50989.1 hypothetical protein [Parvibaculum sp.]
MKQSNLFATIALTLGLGVGIFGLTGAAPAFAGAGYHGGGEEDCGCEPPPPPPPADDCGCDDDGGHGGGKNVNNNHNENNNNNTNTNTNTNTNIVNVTVNSSATATASAIANANADTAASAASRAAGGGGGSGRSNSGGSGYGIGNGNGSGGGGGSYYVAAPQATPMGPLNVVTRNEIVVKPVKGVCVSAKGLEEAARFSTPLREVAPEDDVELFHCLAGDMLVATIGRLVDDEGRKMSDYTAGYTIECREGEALRHGSNGMLACAPLQGRLVRGDAAEGRQAYAEIMIRKSGGAEQVVSTAGGAWFSGGVGY